MDPTELSDSVRPRRVSLLCFVGFQHTWNNGIPSESPTNMRVPSIAFSSSFEDQGAFPRIWSAQCIRDKQGLRK